MRVIERERERQRERERERETEKTREKKNKTRKTEGDGCPSGIFGDRPFHTFASHSVARDLSTKFSEEMSEDKSERVPILKLWL